MTTPIASSTGRRSALIVGHPGHELRVWGWMHAAKPAVAVLTDGGGRDGTSRLHLSERLCRHAGATVSTCFGVATDRRMYQAILENDYGFFLGITDRLAQLLIDAEIDVVVADAAEGYNPTHDVCRLVVDRAIRLAGVRRRIDSYAFLLTGSPVVAAPGADWISVTLDDTALAEKIAAAREYAAADGGALLGEIDGLIDRFGTAAFAKEYLLPVDASKSSALAPDKPFYETHGERQVALGHYRDVIRLAVHMVPIERALRC